VNVLLAAQQAQPWSHQELRLRLRRVVTGFV